MNVKIFNVCMLIGWLMVLAGGVLVHPGWGIAIAGGLLLLLTLVSAYFAGLHGMAKPVSDGGEAD